MNQRPVRGVSMNHNEVLLDGDIVDERDEARVRGVVLNHNEALI
jgi:hypothetical protein